MLSICIDDRNPLFYLGEIYEGDENVDWIEKGYYSCLYNLVPRCLEPSYGFYDESPELIYCHKTIINSNKEILFEAGHHYYNFSKFFHVKPYQKYMVLLAETKEYIDFQNVPIDIFFEYFIISSSFYPIPKGIKEKIPSLDFNQTQSLLLYKEDYEGNIDLLMPTENISDFSGPYIFMVSPLRIGHRYQVNYEESDQVMPVFFKNHEIYRCERKNSLTDSTGSKYNSILTKNFQFTNNLKEEII